MHYSTTWAVSECLKLKASEQGKINQNTKGKYNNVFRYCSLHNTVLKNKKCYRDLQNTNILIRTYISINKIDVNSKKQPNKTLSNSFPTDQLY